MRLVSYDAGDGARAGVLEDERVVDAWAALGEPHRGSLRELIAAGRIDDLRARLGDTGAPSHPRSRGVACCRRSRTRTRSSASASTTRKHAAEGGMELPASPTIFGKYRNALAAPGATVTLPANSRKVDYEAEVAFVVGRRAKRGRRGRRARLRRRLHAAQRPLRPRPPVRHAAVDVGQGLRRLGALRAGAGHPRRGRAARRDRDRADAERRADAGRLDRGPDLQRPAAALPPLGADDAGAGRHRLDRHPGRGRRRPRPAGLARRRRRGRGRVPHPGPARDAASPPERAALVVAVRATRIRGLGPGRRSRRPWRAARPRAAGSAARRGCSRRAARAVAPSRDQRIRYGREVSSDCQVSVPIAPSTGRPWRFLEGAHGGDRQPCRRSR